MVYKKPNGELFIFDWKRTTKLVNDIGTIIKTDFGLNSAGKVRF